MWVQRKAEIRELPGDYKGFPDLAQPDKDEHGGRQTDREIKRDRGRTFFAIRVERC